MKFEIELPDNLTPHTAKLVQRVAKAMGKKLLAAEEKGRTGWEQPNWQEDCTKQLILHLEKGDPIDCMNFLAFMWYHGWPTSNSVPIHLAGPLDKVILYTSRTFSQEQREMLGKYIRDAENGGRVLIAEGIDGALVIRKTANEVTA